MKPRQLDIVICGLSITSSWGNGHATTYRCLVRGLAENGHRVLFLERDVPWYASNRDAASLPYADIQLYSGLDELRDRFAESVRNADLVIVGSFVPDGCVVGKWAIDTARGVTMFYDIDTPVTLAKLQRGDYEYIEPSLIPQYGAYLSFTGGPTLQYIERQYGAQMTRPLYCAVDPSAYYPEKPESGEAMHKWDLAFLGTYSPERQPAIEELLLKPARETPGRRFAVAGSQFPGTIEWPHNVDRIEHLAPGDHRHFYNSQRFTLNVTRAEMVRAGYSPSVRLFEAAACGTPIISDNWPGLDEFFVPDQDILIASNSTDIARYLSAVPEEKRCGIAERARQKTLASHTGKNRADEIESHYLEAQQMAVSEPVSAQR